MAHLRNSLHKLLFKKKVYQSLRNRCAVSEEQCTLLKKKQSSLTFQKFMYKLACFEAVSSSIRGVLG